MKHSKEEISRFLMQATLGANQATQNRVAHIGIKPWVKQQLDSPIEKNDSFESTTREIWHYFRSKLLKAHGELAINGDGNNPALPYNFYFRMAWWHKTLTADPAQLLRHRIALALSELLVISDSSVLELDSIGFANYYDILYRNAFGNYNEILTEVSLHPCMGVYLSHMNNQKADPSKHIHPDENYAREIMQLFSIGLYELNQDGSRKKDLKGNEIPTYDNRDIKELARVFTGLTASNYEYEWINSFWQESFNGYKVSFEDGIDKTYKTIPFVNMTEPMIIDERFHDRHPKTLLNGKIKLKGNQSGKTEIETVVNELVKHPNTAPFVAKHLITQLVTSNPTPDYVSAVAKKFGSKGNLKATIEEVLTYPLQNAFSLNQNGKSKVHSQKLKSPVLRTTQLLRALNIKNSSGKYWLTGFSIQEILKQHPMSSPTVFNFYKPDFVPHGLLKDRHLVAPEFELHTSATSINYINLMYYWFFGEQFPEVSTQISSSPGVNNAPEMNFDKLQRVGKDKLRMELETEINMAKDIRSHDKLIERLSILLTGKSDPKLNKKIKNSYSDYKENPLWVVQTIIFMIAISPEFTVMEA